MFPSVLTAILFAGSIVCATQSARILGGSEANFWRLATAIIFLALWAHLFGGGLGGPSFPLFLTSGIIGVGSDVFLFQSLPRIGSRLSTLLLQCLSVVFASALEWVWLGNKLTTRQLEACVIILAGVALALAPSKHLNIKRATLIVGICFATVAALGNAFGAVLSRLAYSVAEKNHQNVDGGTAAYQRLIGGLFVGGVCLLIVKRREIAAQWQNPSAPRWPQPEKWKRAWPWVIANGFAGQTLGVTCYQWALRTTKTGVVLAIVATTPLIVIPFAHYWEGERVHRRALIGGLIAVAGVALLALEKFGIGLK